jgi:tetratricopeptide (TPR) repeat protein
MKYFMIVLFLLLSAMAGAQTSQSTEQIRAQMAKIRQTTNWDDPVAAERANAELKKLASQMTGGKPPLSPPGNQQSKQGASSSPVISLGASAATKENIIAIANRFYNRSYKALDAVSKSQFDLDIKAAGDKGFSLEAVRILSGTGGFWLTFGTDHHVACVYLASAVKAFPSDTLSINNFGAYLRNIDSVAISVPVLLYANQLFSESPLILTQLGNSYFELNELTKAESYYKQALEVNPDFGQAHTSLCDLYIQQNRFQDAILELFAGVKGMGFSYSQASGSFSALQSQAENSPGGESEKEKFWEETRNQMNPPDALASLVPEVDRLKLPAFSGCSEVTEWMEGGGYASALDAYKSFHGQLKKFNQEFLRIQNEVPNLSPNAVLRDYPNERFALDCIMEYFFQASDEESDESGLAVDDVMKSVSEIVEAYVTNKERYGKEYVSCTEPCVISGDGYCIKECRRKYCSKECPAAIQLNKDIQGQYEEYKTLARMTTDNQRKILDDLYEFSGQWFSRIESPYWSRIYAYEIQRVALSIIGNAFIANQQAFPLTAGNECGTDCSVYANPYPLPPEKVEEKTPKANECPDLVKGKVGFGPCDLSLDCESIEFGCSIGVAGSLKRNFVKKTTTGFLGVGVKGSAGFISAGAKAGFEVTVSDNNEVKDVGVKADVSVSLGPGVTKLGFSTSGNYSVMTGPKASAGVSFGGKAK